MQLQFSSSMTFPIHQTDYSGEELAFLFALADHYIKHGELLRARAVAEQMIKIQPDNKAGHDIKAYVDKLLDPSPRSTN